MSLESFPLLVAPDWGLTTTLSAELEEQDMGDGYRLVRPKGINYLRESWSPSWPMLDQEQCDTTYQWLKARLKVTQFLWTHPTSGVTHKVTCESVSRVDSDVGLFSLRATFQEGFNV